jgi:TonB family protein
MFFRTVQLIAALLAGLSAPAVAQSTAVYIPPPAIIEGETFPVPKQLEIRDADYPLESLLANEEGRVTLNLVVGADGRVAFAQVLAGSGSARLDQAAAQLARTRWTFEPHSKAGQPSVGAARVDVTWKAPLRPAYEYQMDTGLLPAEGEINFVPAVATTSHALRAEDYPAYAVRTGLQGTVSLRFVILESGGVGDVSVAQTKRLGYAG